MKKIARNIRKNLEKDIISPLKIKMCDVIPHEQLFLYITRKYSGQWNVLNLICLLIIRMAL